MHFPNNLQRFTIVAALAVFFSGCSQKQPKDATTPVEPSHASNTVTHWFRSDGSLNWEAEKQERHIATDTIVIHHTASASSLSASELSSIGRERMYVPRFASSNPEPYVQGKIPSSGHYRIINGHKTEVFYTYHWLIHEDGGTERLLEDTEVGWHAGDWGMNMRSIAICFDGDFEQKPPSDAAIHTCAQLVAKYQKQLGKINLIGHSDVVATRCPGNWFESFGKTKILELATKRH